MSIVVPPRMTTAVPSAETVLTTAGGATKIADLTNAKSGKGVVTVYNRAAFEVFYTFGTPSGSGLTTGNGVSIPANAYLAFDDIGGMCLWAITGTNMTAGSGLRVTSAYWS